MEETMKRGDKPLLSIVVPVYNGSAYIDELFSQLDKQMMDSVEMVFIDDGSKDDSLAKLTERANRTDFAVSVYHQENKGVSVARNYGVQMARGEYLAFLDVDDGIVPNFVSVLMDYAQQGINVLVFDSLRVKPGDSRLTQASTGNVAGKTVSKQEMLMEFLRDPTRFGVYNLILRRTYLTEKNITFPIGYKYYEDYDYLLQVFAQTDDVTRLEQTLYFYIMREGSAMGRFNAERINCLRLMKHREQWLEEVAPEFATDFRQWGIARLYWSILWQAALAFPSYREFAEFTELTHAQKYLVKLKGYPDKLLQLSTAIFLICKPVYYFAINMVGRSRSAVAIAYIRDIRANLMGDAAYY